MFLRIVFLLFALIGVNIATCHGDMVVYANPRGTGKIALRGDIVDFTNQKMLFRTITPETMREIPADLILTWETGYQSIHQQARESIKKHQFSKALEQLYQAQDQEPRSWMKRTIQSELILCRINLNQYPQAAEQFLKLVRLEPQTRHLDVIPLIWTDHATNSAEFSFAKQWLKSRQHYERLIAGSWLLTSSDYQVDASNVLKELLVHPDITIRGLARCQLWREDIKEGPLNDPKIDRWEQQAESLPIKLRTGPMVLLGQAYEQLVDYQLASARYLWPITMDSRNVPLTQWSTRQAIDLLKKLGQSDAAQTLDQELAKFSGLAGKSPDQ